MNPDYKIMLFAWAGVAVWVTIVILMNRKVHPKALFTLFMVELWERFSYYGMRAFLILYMTAKVVSGGFGFDDARAYGIYGAYGALVYLTPLIGGYFADKLLGFRKAIIVGAILMGLGQFTLFMDNQVTFFIGLALLVVGNGFFKPNISSMVGRFYGDADGRRDGAFTLFYMGINMGAFLAPLTCGAIAKNEGWNYGFLAAGIGMVLGFIIFLWGQRQGIYEEIGIKPDEEVRKDVVKQVPNALLPYVAILIMVVLSYFLIMKNDVVDVILSVLMVGIFGFLFVQAGKMEKVAKQRIWVIVLLLFFTTVFWSFFELAGSALNLFTARNVDRTIFDYEIDETFFQSFNPLFIMLFAPVFSWLWIKLSNANKEPSAPYKFGIGLILLGVGFLVLKLGNGEDSNGMIPAIFMISLYLLHTLGELVLSPVGLSLVTKLSPKQMVAYMMGIWFLSSSIAHQAGKHIAKLTTVNEKTIVESRSFELADMDGAIKELIMEENYKNQLSEMSVEELMVQDDFVSDLNSRVNGTKNGTYYYVSQVVISEVVEDAKKYRGNKQIMVENAAIKRFLTVGDSINTEVATLNEAWQIMEATPVTAIRSAVKNESLNLGLKVFQWLGFIAIGCGVLLFLLGPLVKRWMHGIN
jgi:POT family proton-dependent oligopeptide transporter